MKQDRLDDVEAKATNCDDNDEEYEGNLIRRVLQERQELLAACLRVIEGHTIRPFFLTMDALQACESAIAKAKGE